MDFQAWMAPVLYIMGTITSIVAFCRLCKPVWLFIQSPKQMMVAVKDLDKKVDRHFASTDAQMNDFRGDLTNITQKIEDLHARLDSNDKGTEALLRERILETHRLLMNREFISPEEYEATLEMFNSYKNLGGNHFVDRLMQDINKKKLNTNCTAADTTD